MMATHGGSGVRLRRTALTVTALLFGGALAAGCGDDEAEEDISGPRSPPALKIVSVTGGSGSEWKPDLAAPVVASCDPTRSVGIRVDVNDEGGESTFTFRPPGACGGAPQCGYMTASVADGGALAWTSASSFVTVRLADSGFQPGEHRFRVELRDDQGNAVSNAGALVFDEVVVDVQEPSGCDVDAGGDAAPEAGEAETSSDVAAEADASDDAEDDVPDAGADAADAADAGQDAEDAAPDSPGDVEDADAD
jgi:hypothetical protein